MADTLTEAVARLYRAGDEQSQQQRKLREAITAFLQWLRENQQVLPKPLPLNCTFYPSGEFVRTKLSNPPNGHHEEVFHISLGHEYSREQIFEFSSLIAAGFVERLAGAINQDTQILKRTANLIEQARFTDCIVDGCHFKGIPEICGWVTTTGQRIIVMGSIFESGSWSLSVPGERTRDQRFTGIDAKERCFLSAAVRSRHEGVV